MNRTPARPTGVAIAIATTVALIAPASHAAGARLFKSGPIQITADGAFVWVANPATDSITRVETATDATLEIPMPDPTLRHQPLGLSVREDGNEVWVACHDSDRIYVFDAAGSLLQQIDLPWGSGPHSIALSRDQRRALVTLHRAAGLAVIDTATRFVTTVLEPVYWSPLGVAWMEDGVSAWVTHLFADGEDPFLTRVDFSGADPKVTARIIVKSTNPKQSNGAAGGVAEGGYLTFRGHLAQIPSATGRNELWLPTQYNNINDNQFSPDSTVQTTLRRLDLSSDVIPNTNTDKIILTATQVHDPQACGTPLVGPGWDAHISGPVDIGFSTDGQLAYVVAEQSNDLVVVRHDTPANQTAGFQVTEIGVGWKPMGVAVSPVADVAFVMNELSRSISVIDLQAGVELRQIVVTSEPLSAGLLNGARIFHTSVDPTNSYRISSNEKVACASCHPQGEHDGRIWNFESLPGQHGPRSTMSLLNLFETIGPIDAATGWGQLHRSGDRDEIEDFEHTFQGVNMGGAGFLGAGVCAELDPACLNANQGSSDLANLAAYVMSLRPVARSPFRQPGGVLSEAAVRGATFFMGANAAMPADANCASCHVPSTGFVDFQFHDVGQRRAGSEQELNNRTPPWHVNTATLRSIWSSPPYDGVSGWVGASLVAVVNDLAGRTSHGRTSMLTGRQRRDLAELLASIDGDMTATEISSAVDTTPPRIVRVEPASLTTVDVWFSESVDLVTASNPNGYEIEKLSDGSIMPILSATWDPQHGDRVTLTTQIEASCGAIDYELRPAAGVVPILDLAATASGGVNNPLDLSDASNTHRFTVGNTITVTLGASGYENITINVHDAGMVGPGLATWSHDSPWLGNGSGGGCNGTAFVNKGFVRFDWSTAFAAVTGVTSAVDIIDASFSLAPEWGDAQDVDVRRTLLPWSDPSTGNDWNSNAPCGPTWREHAHGGACAHATGNWNQAGARATTAGVEGQSVADYDAGNDVAFTPDTRLTMDAINTRQTVAGPQVSDAFRFWFANPQVDYGYALELPGTPGRMAEVKFDRVETDLNEHGPVLTITYQLPVTPMAPREVSGRASNVPLYVVEAPASDVRFSFEDLGPEATTYSVYEGTIGSYYSHAGATCNATPLATAGRREQQHTPAAGNRYFIVTASNACAEGPSDLDHPVGLHDCLP